MEIFAKYIAKDGKSFDDPMECQEYEKTIGILSGSVGELIHLLDKNTKRNYYIFGVVKIRDGNKGYIYTRYTACIDYLLEDYVNVEDLPEEKRYEKATVGELADTLRKLDKDLPCQFFIIFSETVDLKCPGCIANHNPYVWNDKTNTL